MSSAAPLTSVVLPTYNERESVGPVIAGVLDAFEDAALEVEIIVVDDDSPDETWQFVRDTYQMDDRVQVMRRQGRSGLSSAVLDGFHAASGDIGVCMDADGQHPPEQSVVLAKWVADPSIHCDLAYGTRYAEGGRIENWPAWRRVVSTYAMRLSTVFVPDAREISDPMSGFFAVELSVVDEETLQACDPHGYKILLELVTVADLETLGVPITFRERERGESKFTIDEAVRFVEQIVGLAFVSSGLDRYLTPPQAIRAVELGASSGAALAIMFIGLILGDVDGAAGAGLIAVSGGLLTLSLLRFARTGEQWRETWGEYA
jgi:dolichol-phosphate mannosyltransferase